MPEEPAAAVAAAPKEASENARQTENAMSTLGTPQPPESPSSRETAFVRHRIRAGTGLTPPPHPRRDCAGWK